MRTSRDKTGLQVGGRAKSRVSTTRKSVFLPEFGAAKQTKPRARSSPQVLAKWCAGRTIYASDTAGTRRALQSHLQVRVCSILQARKARYVVTKRFEGNLLLRALHQFSLFRVLCQGAVEATYIPSSRCRKYPQVAPASRENVEQSLSPLWLPSADASLCASRMVLLACRGAVCF